MQLPAAHPRSFRVLSILLGEVLPFVFPIVRRPPTTTISGGPSVSVSVNQHMFRSVYVKAAAADAAVFAPSGCVKPTVFFETILLWERRRSDRRSKKAAPRGSLLDEQFRVRRRW
jgi:hypothetical protein